ncbi:unnamed protein product [Colias eurytheme]|nr:unnamed protein product [Colias eurytheme]
MVIEKNVLKMARIHNTYIGKVVVVFEMLSGLGDRSEEHRKAGTDTRHELAWAASLRGALDTFWRALSVSRRTSYRRHNGDYLTGVGTTPRAAQRWVVTEHQTRTSPVTLLPCYGDSTSPRESPPRPQGVTLNNAI